jgi:glycosyltransferase involved in cell wall biosynthesis
MDILVIHNSYQQHGGEDEVFGAEVRLLSSRGHRMVEYRANNDTIRQRSATFVAMGTVWSRESYAAIGKLIKQERPQVVHIHNTLPLISPAAYYAAKRADLPVVQTLHNYRLLCPSATLFRNGATCTECVGRSIPWPGVIHRCYRDSAAATGTVAAMLSIHRLLRTWTRCVDVYLALTESSRRLFISAGLPPEKIVVKPNFVHPDPRNGMDARPRKGALFIGRLVPEKGIRTLLRAWREIGDRVPLEIIGDGPLAQEVDRASREIPGVRWLGAVEKPRVYEALAQACMLIVPSEWYEPFSIAVIESYAMGVPVIASKIGGLEHIVHDRGTGLHFEPGNFNQLCAKVLWLASNEGERDEMVSRSRTEYERRYTADANYPQLMEAYRLAISGRSQSRINEISSVLSPGVRNPA